MCLMCLLTPSSATDVPEGFTEQEMDDYMETLDALRRLMARAAVTHEPVLPVRTEYIACLLTSTKRIQDRALFFRNKLDSAYTTHPN